MGQIVYTPERIQEVLSPVLRRHNVKRAVLFGSYAKGNAGLTSDVDLLVDSGLHGLSFFGLLEDIVTALGKAVDLLDVSQIEPGSEIDQEILRTGVLIYG